MLFAESYMYKMCLEESGKVLSKCHELQLHTIAGAEATFHLSLCTIYVQESYNRLQLHMDF